MEGRVAGKTSQLLGLLLCGKNVCLVLLYSSLNHLKFQNVVLAQMLYLLVTCFNFPCGTESNI